MKRFRPAASPHLVRASGDRWLFGYADIVTLLLACFVCLYASTLSPAATEQDMASPHPAPAAPASDARTSSTPVRQLDALTGAAGDATSPPVDGRRSPGTSSQDQSLESGLRELVGATSSLGVEVAASDRGLVVSVPEAGSFPAGQADLSPEARLVMSRLADTLRDRPNQIRVEGHTDDVPMRTAKYGSNWELSTARATRVVQFFIEDAGLTADRLSAAGYAEYRPRVANDSPAHRARNRRVDIVILEAAGRLPGSPAAPVTIP